MIADKIISDDKIKNLQGEFFNFNHYDTLINKDTDIYTPEGHLLFSIRKKIIPKKISNIAKKHLLPRAIYAKSNSRGVATGKVNLDYMNNSIVELLDPGNFKTRVKYEDGHISTYKVSNNCKSMIAGYYDKALRGDRASTSIRLTSFSLKYPDDWCNIITYVQYLDKIYKSIYKDNYVNRKKKLPKYGIIDNTIFTTLTINYNFRTACHVDKGNDDYSILTTIGDWKGCYLGYPQYGVCVNVEEGDFLIMNPYEYHCNTEFIGASQNRMSIVTYSRDGIINS
jgi:hypothetical protein